MSNSLQKQTKIRLSKHLKLTKRYEKTNKKQLNPTTANTRFLAKN